MTKQMGMNLVGGKMTHDSQADTPANTYTTDNYGVLATALLGKSSIMRRFVDGNASLFAQGTDATQLSELHRVNPYAKIIVDLPIQESLSRGRSWKHQDPEKNAELTAYENNIDLWQTVEEGLELSSLHGGSIIFIRTTQTDVSVPLNEEAIRKGGILGLTVFRRGQLTNIEIDNTPGSLTFGKAIMYHLNTNANSAMGRESSNVRRIHASHLIELRGERKITSYGMISMADYLGDSALLSCLQAINDMTLAQSYQILLMAEAKSPTVAIKGLAQKMGSPEGINQLVTYFDTFHRVKGITGTNFIDKDSEFKNNAIPFTSIGEMMDQFRTTLASCAQIPRTYLFEEQSQGLNNSQLGDNTKFNGRIARFQSSKIDYPMQLFNRILVRAALGTDEVIPRMWNPLTQLTRVEQSSLLMNELNIINTAQSMGNLPPERAKMLTEHLLGSSGIGDAS